MDLGVSLSERPVPIREIEFAFWHLANQLARLCQSVFDFVTSHRVLTAPMLNEALTLLAFKAG